MKTGCFLFLLDGYDEIASKKKDVFFKKLDAFCDKYSSNSYIVSSRPCSDFIEFQRFTVLSTKAFSKEQSISLVNRLDYDCEIKDRFISALDNELYDRLTSFASNPLLLNIMLITFDNYAEIPEKLHLFYSNAFETLYYKHDATKAGYRREMKCKLPYDAFRKVFSYFCFISYNQKKVSFSYVDLYELLEKSSDRSKISFVINDYIYDLVNSLCVLYREGFEYIFTHRSFQEYFTSVFLKELTDANMEKIGFQMISRDLYRAVTDSVFSMLYDMSEDRFEQNIFLPVLDEYERECTEADKYDFYFQRMERGISFQKTKNEKYNLRYSYYTESSKITFLYIFTRQYIAKTREIREVYEKGKHAEKALLDYLVKNHPYVVHSIGILVHSSLISDQIAYELFKDTWIGELIKTMSTLSATLRNNQKRMRLDMDDLMNYISE